MPAGDLVEARDATNVVVVGRDEVLVVGSDYETTWQSACGAATNGSDSVEIGDALATHWERTSSLKSKREAPFLVALDDGRALLTGGETGEGDGNVAYSSTYVFDATDRSWTKSGLMNTARSGPAGALLSDGRVLVVGGIYNDGAADHRVLDSSEIWDPATGSWTKTGRLAQARFDASAVTLADGRVLVVGGMEMIETEIGPEVYDPASGRWSAAGTLTAPQRGFVLVPLADGGALVAGGFDDSAEGVGQQRLKSVERFDPVSNSWSTADDLPYTTAGASGVQLADGRVLVAGGSAREPEVINDATGDYISGLATEAALFDPRTGRWTPTAPMPSRRAGASAVLLADGSALLVGGSESEGELYSTPGCPVAAPQVLRFVPGS